MNDPGTQGLETLPEVVRARVLTLAADALGRMPADQLPPALKRVASFTPARRARLAGSQIARALDCDPDFRERLATQVRARVPELAGSLEDTPNLPSSPEADPVDLAAAAYLLRPEGWEAVVADGAKVVAERSSGSLPQSPEEANRRLRRLRDLEATIAQLRSTRERSRQQVADLKADNAALRHKLGAERTRARTAEQDRDRLRAAAEQSVSSAGSAVSAAEAEARRLGARVRELERELGLARRAGRVGKEEGTLRTRLLLDTLLDAAQGLRRELALPAVPGVPADSVEADIAQAGSRTPSGHGSLALDDPALLDQLMKLPRVHVVVDGYNVTKTTWPSSSLETQRDRLMSALAPLAARSGAEVTVVFDAADVAERPLVNRPRGVRVLFSPVGVIADDVIRELVTAEPRGRPVVVVSSDQEVVADVSRSGARAVASDALARLLRRS